MSIEKRLRSRGVSLIETLISLAVVALGLLAMCSLQLNLARHTDTSRQRTEATHLAQQSLERMRGFEQIDSSAGKFAWSDLASGDDEASIGTGSSFTRRWTVAGDASNATRIATVTVSWPDRGGGATPSSVTLTTLLARIDPSDVGGLLQAPESDFRLARQRSPSIPLSATRLGGANRGSSVMAWPSDGRGHLVFDNASGDIVARCASEPGDATDIAASCTASSAVLLEGYVNAVDRPADGTLVFEPIPLSPGSSATRCVVTPATNPRTTAVIAGVYRYGCLVESAARAPSVPQGRLRFTSLRADLTACQYASEHSVNEAQTYTRANDRHEQSNFVLATIGACPVGTVPYPST